MLRAPRHPSQSPHRAGHGAVGRPGTRAEYPAATSQARARPRWRSSENVYQASSSPGQLLEVDQKRTQHGCGPIAERRVELVGEIVVTLPGAFPQLLGAPPGQVGRSLHALGQREEEPVTRELEQLVPEPLRHCDDDASTVRIEDGTSKSNPTIVDTAHQLQLGRSRSSRRRRVRQSNLSSPVAARRRLIRHQPRSIGTRLEVIT
jgi:hypothetical protein